MSDDSPKEGRLRPATAEWKMTVRGALAERGKKAELSRWLGIPQASLNKVLSPGTHNSRLVDPISEYLGIAAPTIKVQDETEIRFLEVVRLLSDDNRDLVLRMAEKLAAVDSSDS